MTEEKVATRKLYRRNKSQLDGRYCSNQADPLTGSLLKAGACGTPDDAKGGD